MQRRLGGKSRTQAAQCPAYQYLSNTLGLLWRKSREKQQRKQNGGRDHSQLINPFQALVSYTENNRNPMIKKTFFHHHLVFHREAFPESCLKLVSPDQATEYSNCVFQGLRPFLFNGKFKVKYFHKSPGMTKCAGYIRLSDQTA